MAIDIRTLDPDDPNYEALVEQALQEEDVADGRGADSSQATAGDGAGTEGEGEGGQGGQGEGADETSAAGAAAATERGADGADGPAAAAAPAAGAGGQGEGEGEGEASAAESSAARPAAGVLGKDGKTVLPYQVLKGAREEARNNRIARQLAEERAAQLQAQLDALGHKPTAPATNSDELTDEDRELPAVAKLEAQIKRIAPNAAAAAPGADAPGGDAAPEDIEAVVQEAIDSVPALAAWQAAPIGSPERAIYVRAVKLDELLRESPKWKDKPLTERFAHVARTVASEFDVPLEEEPGPGAKTPKPASPSPQAQPRKDPREVVAAAPRKAPETLSAFKGGASERAGTPLERATGPAQVARFADMSDEEIERHLAKLG